FDKLRAGGHRPPALTFRALLRPAAAPRAPRHKKAKGQKNGCAGKSSSAAVREDSKKEAWQAMP
ncbi:MAG: hypothetical protein UIK34_05340, partial [Christensenellales bacterium]|nr:hypothetical protein [Christensenellales bacterium]